jgi:hypothetical protein
MNCHRLAASSSLALAACVLAASARADDEGPSVTPYRPSVSTPAQLSAPGWLEVESGLQRAWADDPDRLDNLSYSLKLAFSPDWGVRIDGDAWIHQLGADGRSTSGGGDTALVLKRRFAVDDTSAFGLELGAKAATAGNNLGSGHADYGLNGIYSADLTSAWHLDLNLSETHLGGASGDAGAWQAGWAADLSRALSDQWGLTGEFSGTAQRGEGPTAQFLFAASYSPRHAVSFDFGLSRGFNAASGDWALFAGVTFLAGKLF